MVKSKYVDSIFYLHEKKRAIIKEKDTFKCIVLAMLIRVFFPVNIIDFVSDPSIVVMYWVTLRISSNAVILSQYLSHDDSQYDILYYQIGTT